jgi:hypothetical protein
MTTEEVAAWVTHALQLPKLAGTFREHAVTGYDFPALVADGGEALETELGIASKLHRRQIMRAVQVLMLGVGRRPDDPQSPTIAPAGCGALDVTIRRPRSNGVAIHRYLLQHRVKGNATWETRIVGASSSVRETVSITDLDPVVEHTFRVEAWNSIGRSGWSGPESAFANQGCDDFMDISGVWELLPSLGPVLLSAGIAAYTLMRLGICARRDEGAQFAGTGAREPPHALHALLTPPATAFRLPAARPPVGSAGGGVGGGGGWGAAAAAAAATRSPTTSRALGSRLPTEGVKTRPLAAQLPVQAAASKKPSLQACYVCGVDFSLTKRRHHCLRCHNVFCGSHGVSAHSAISVCAVPSKCCCAPCAAELGREE